MMAPILLITDGFFEEEARQDPKSLTKDAPSMTTLSLFGATLSVRRKSRTKKKVLSLCWAMAQQRNL